MFPANARLFEELAALEALLPSRRSGRGLVAGDNVLLQVFVRMSTEKFLPAIRTLSVAPAMHDDLVFTLQDKKEKSSVFILDLVLLTTSG